MSIMSRSYRQIPAQYVSSAEVKQYLAGQIHGLVRGMPILFVTRFVDRQRRSAFNDSFEDIIATEHYLGIAGADEGEFLEHLNPRSDLGGRLALQMEAFVSSGELVLTKDALLLWSMLCTPIDQPIPREFVSSFHIGECDDVYPFTIFVGHDKIEEYLVNHSDGRQVVDFYVIARRMLGLPTPHAEWLKETDERVVRELVLSLYAKWMRVPHGYNREVTMAIKGRVARLKEMRVEDEHLQIDMSDAPGLFLDVTAFLEGVESALLKQ